MQRTMIADERTLAGKPADQVLEPGLREKPVHAFSRHALACRGHGFEREAADASVLFLAADPGAPCGVGDFTNRLIATMRDIAPNGVSSLALGNDEPSAGELWRSLTPYRTVVCNFPLVAWKRLLIKPLAALALARLRRREAVVVLHEWASLHRLRRAALRPALLLANRIVLFSPLIARELAADRWVGHLAKRAVLAPLPPNLERPDHIAISGLSQKLAAIRAAGHLVVATFGSIYPGKQPQALLEIGAALKAKGHKPFLVHIGSFVKGSDHVEEDYWAKVETLGLAEDVLVTGYVASDADLFGLFREVDAFVYALPEGLTSRRASVLASVQAGKPVIVTEPADMTEFAHHPRFRALIETGTLTTVPRDASPEDYAEAVLKATAGPVSPAGGLDVAAWWRDAAEAIGREL